MGNNCVLDNPVERGVIPYLSEATGLCTQDGMNAGREVQPTIHLPQIPHGKLHICHNNSMLACHFNNIYRTYINGKATKRILFARTAPCCHLAHLLSCKLLKVRKQVYQQRDLCFLYQLLRPMQLIPETTDRTFSIVSWNLDAEPGSKETKQI